MMKSPCQLTSLASRGSFKVERCSCGSIHLHVGTQKLPLEASSIEQLATTLVEAAVNNSLIEAAGLRGERGSLSELGHGPML